MSVTHGVVNVDSLFATLKRNIKGRWELDFLDGGIIHFLISRKNFNRVQIAERIGKDHNWVGRHQVYYLLVLGIRRYSGINTLLPPYSICTVVDVDTVSVLIDYGIEKKFNFENSSVADWMLLQQHVNQLESRKRSLEDTQDVQPLRENILNVEERRQLLITNAQNKIRDFHEKLSQEKNAQLSSMPEYIKNIVSEVCFFVSGFNTGKRKSDYKIKHDVETWLKNRAFLADELVLPFPNWALERVFFKHMFEEEYVKTRCYIVKQPEGGVYLAIIRNAVPADLVAHITSATHTLAQNRPQQSFQSKRGEGNYFLFGYHRFSSPETMSYAHMVQPEFLQWTVAMLPYFEIVRALLRKHIPSMMNIKGSKLGNENPFHPYTAGQVNFETLALPHVDDTDLSGTLNCLTTIGKFSGGELFFPDLNVKIDIQPGDVIFFEGSRLKHQVLPIGQQDTRTSINLYINSLFFYLLFLDLPTTEYLLEKNSNRRVIGNFFWGLFPLQPDL